MLLSSRRMFCSPSMMVIEPPAAGAWLTGVRLTEIVLPVSKPPAPSSTVITKLSLLGAVICAPLWV